MKLRLLFTGLILIALVVTGITINSARLSPKTSGGTSDPLSSISEAPPTSVSATLTIDVGLVLFKSENQWAPAIDGQVLFQGNSVKTGSGAQASLAFEHIGELRLEQQTEITITALTPITVRVYQTIGDTYSKVKKLFDPASSYEVETPTAVASVRGTAFGVLVNTLQESRIVVSENIVDVAPIVQEGQIRTRLPAALVTENQGTIINPTVIAKARAAREAPPVMTNTFVLPPEKTKWIEQNRQKDRDFDQKSQEEILQTIQGISSGSAQPISALDNCQGEACADLCAKPENADRCQRVSQEKQQGKKQDKQQNNEQEQQREKRDDKLAPITTVILFPTPTNNPIQQMVQPIRNAIERFISPYPKPPEPEKHIPPRSPSSSNNPGYKLRYDQKENEKMLESDEEKVREIEKIRSDSTPEDAIKSPQVPSLSIPLSPAPNP